jgi:drug/metabolite transporter (DMT)-like permease
MLRPLSAAGLPQHLRQPLWAVVLAMGLVYVVWGSTYLGIRVTVETLPAFLSSGLRFFVAGLLVLAVLALRRRRRPAIPPWPQVAAASVVGIVLLLGGAGLISLAVTRVPSNIAAVLASTTSIWVVLYRLAGRERLRPLALAGVGIGFLGVMILLLPGGSAAGVAVGWLALCVLSSWFWSAGSFYGRRLPLPPDPFVAAVIQMLAGGLALGLVGVATGELGDVHLENVSARSAIALVYLVTAGGIAYSAYVWLLQHVPIATVVTHQYVNPVVAITLGWIILDESLPLVALAGAALIVGAVVTIVRAEGRSQEQPQDAT